MAPGRPGRIPAIVDMLKRAKRPMSSREIAAVFRDNGDETATAKVIGAALSRIADVPNGGVRRHTRRGFYVWDPDEKTAHDNKKTARETDERFDAYVDYAAQARAVDDVILGANLPPLSIRRGGIKYPTESARAKEIREEQARNAADDATLNRLRDGLENMTVGETASRGILVSADSSAAIPAGFPFTKVHVHARLRDGRVLFTDERDRAWIAKEI